MLLYWHLATVSTGIPEEQQGLDPCRLWIECPLSLWERVRVRALVRENVLSCLCISPSVLTPEGFRIRGGFPGTPYSIPGDTILNYRPRAVNYVCRLLNPEDAEDAEVRRNVGLFHWRTRRVVCQAWLPGSPPRRLSRPPAIPQAGKRQWVIVAQADEIRPPSLARPLLFSKPVSRHLRPLPPQYPAEHGPLGHAFHPVIVDQAVAYGWVLGPAKGRAQPSLRKRVTPYL
jgi:hypothetical protein